MELPKQVKTAKEVVGLFRSSAELGREAYGAWYEMRQRKTDSEPSLKGRLQFALECAVIYAAAGDTDEVWNMLLGFNEAIASDSTLEGADRAELTEMYWAAVQSMPAVK